MNIDLSLKTESEYRIEVFHLCAGGEGGGGGRGSGAGIRNRFSFEEPATALSPKTNSPSISSCLVRLLNKESPAFTSNMNS